MTTALRPRGGTCGGGIVNHGILTLTASVVSDSQASDQGGSIFTTGTLTLNASGVRGNQAGVMRQQLDEIYRAVQRLGAATNLPSALPLTEHEEPALAESGPPRG